MNFEMGAEPVSLPAMHFVFVEKVGPFEVNAPQAWQNAHALVPELVKRNEIVGFLSLYKREPQIYRAGFALAAAPVELPAGMGYEQFSGGKYVRFVLIGSYSNMPAASGRAWSDFEEKGFPARDAFAVEQYMNDPRVTPEDQLITHILIPVQ
jgi:DNA gyrase inhibitor GyrI